MTNDLKEKMLVAMASCVTKPGQVWVEQSRLVIPPSLGSSTQGTPDVLGGFLQGLAAGCAKKNPTKQERIKQYLNEGTQQ